MDELEMDKDVVIDHRTTHKLTDNLGHLRKDINIIEEIMGDDTGAIIVKHYYEQFARPYNEW
jgi:hypothetical protein